MRKPERGGGAGDRVGVLAVEEDSTGEEKWGLDGVSVREEAGVVGEVEVEVEVIVVKVTEPL